MEILSSRDAFEIIKNVFNPYAEEIWLIPLDSQLKMIRREMIFRGTANVCLIHPRDIFRTLILNNACSFILAHNHPSGQTQPSEYDLIITRRLHKLSLLMEIPLNDHLVFSATNYHSMADHGFFKKRKRSTII